VYMVGRVLVEAGADLNICNESGCFGTSLHYAIMKVNINKNQFFSANHSCPGAITTVKYLILQKFPTEKFYKNAHT
jgi:hypothetical protein